MSRGPGIRSRRVRLNSGFIVWTCHPRAVFIVSPRQLCNDLLHKFLVGVLFSESLHILDVSRAKPSHSRKGRMLSCWSRISVSGVGRSVLNVARLDSVLAWVGLRLAIRGMGELDLIPLMGFCTSVLSSYVARLQTSAV